MSKFYARMLAMLALIDKEPATHGRNDLAQRYNISEWTVTQTINSAKNEWDVDIKTVGFGKDKRFKLVGWGGFNESWVRKTYERHQSLSEK
mgnify:CR=1 FL=1|tara:strand:- start:807 stop:1079 length:273 start_codon:yes stop_codon:yes gene_type:complete